MPDNGIAQAPLRRSLTPTQLRILTLTAGGHDTAAIAAATKLSGLGVQRQRTHIMDRLDALNMTQAVVIALKRGLISLDELDV